MPFEIQNSVGTCPFCGTFQQLLAHVPKCYREFCHYIEMEPLCTCNDCQGWNPHDNTGPKRRKKSHDVFDEENVCREVYQSTRDEGYSSCQSHGSEISDVPESKPEVSIDQRTGKQCIACDKNKLPSGKNKPLPSIKIGTKFTYNVHKLDHVKQESRFLLKIFSSEIHAAKEDEVFPDPLEEQMDYPVFSNELCLYCDSKQKETPVIVWVKKESNNQKYWLCSPTHLIRYLFDAYCTGRTRNDYEEKRIQGEKGDDSIHVDIGNSLVCTTSSSLDGDNEPLTPNDTTNSSDERGM